MGMYEVEVEGRYTIVLEVEADSEDQAESEAIRAFEQDVDVVTNMGGESWDHTSIVAVHEQEEEPDWDIEAGVR
jgi:hypothetical protein